MHTAPRDSIMKGLLVLFAVITVCTANILKHPLQNYFGGDRFFYFAGDNGIPYLVDAAETVDFKYIEQYTSNNYSEYWLFTRANPATPQMLFHGDIDSVASSNYNRSKVTVFLAHGWNGDGQNTNNKLLTEAFLSNGDVNVIVLDWSKLASRNYLTAKAGTNDVGKGLGQFIKWLVNNGLASYNSIHLVGFSLGGHLVGNAGRETGGAIIRITALDPAGPLWGSDKDRVVSTDAQYVEVIHTDTLLLGYSDPCGDADFYPNGGVWQPGCWMAPCSHGRAYEFMASTVIYNHLWANECDSYRDAANNRCTGTLNPMGNSDLTKKRRGIFRVNTGSSYPF